MTATPAWRRIGVQAHNAMATGFLLISNEMQDKHGGNPHLPVEAIEALQLREIALDHDPDYVKAQLTRQLMVHAWFIYHQDWDIIEKSDCPFITSDNPVAFQPAADFREPPTRIVPLTPTLALSFRATRPKLPAFALSIRASSFGRASGL
jgi:hypothetical protein